MVAVGASVVVVVEPGAAVVVPEPPVVVVMVGSAVGDPEVVAVVLGPGPPPALVAISVSRPSVELAPAALLKTNRSEPYDTSNCGWSNLYCTPPITWTS